MGLADADGNIVAQPDNDGLIIAVLQVEVVAELCHTFLKLKRWLAQESRCRQQPRMNRQVAGSLTTVGGVGHHAKIDRFAALVCRNDLNGILANGFQCHIFIVIVGYAPFHRF